MEGKESLRLSSVSVTDKLGLHVCPVSLAICTGVVAVIHSTVNMLSCNVNIHSLLLIVCV